MIEAVNSVLSNSQALRSGGDGIDVAKAPVPARSSVSDISVPVAPFISPYIQVDVNNNAAILQIRDSDTGDVLNQFPSEARLEQIAREEAARQREATRSDTSDTLAQFSQPSQPAQQAQISQ
ncbi:MAG: hypothetical protein AAF182_04115 [Pseudomonadota bacterium]